MFVHLALQPLLECDTLHHERACPRLAARPCTPGCRSSSSLSGGPAGKPQRCEVTILERFEHRESVKSVGLGYSRGEAEAENVPTVRHPFKSVSRAQNRSVGPKRENPGYDRFAVE
jgi:hypothetical protein